MLLFWKRMPAGAYIYKEATNMSGFKCNKNRVILLLGANIIGFTLKSFFTYYSENPCAFMKIRKHYSKTGFQTFHSPSVYRLPRKINSVQILLLRDIHLISMFLCKSGIYTTK